jgi:hypothetical protein
MSNASFKYDAAGDLINNDSGYGDNVVNNDNI